jgi:hypothetical protein
MVPDDVLPTWLGRELGTELLSVESTPTDAFNSKVTRLHVTYATSDLGLPDRLVLKENREAAWSVEAGQEEVAFYSLVAGLTPRPPGIPPCLAARADSASGDSFVLMLDLSATHVPPLTREGQIGLIDNIPSTNNLGACVTALAHHHAYWWDHPVLRSGQFTVGHWSRDAQRVAAYAERRRASYARMDHSQLLATTRALLEQVLAGLEGHGDRTLAPRFTSERHLTLCHGDTYFTNFLCPRSGTGTTYLLDWQSPEVDLCGNDLANMLAAFWTREQRLQAGREVACLRLYHRALVDRGVVGYTWDDLVTDYRCGLLYWLLVPLQDAADGSDPDYWMPKLTCLEAAVRDWGCLELLT